MKVADLFAGVGGLSQGFIKAGFDIEIAIEFDKDIAASYKKNHPGTDVFAENICDLDFSEIHKKHPQIDVVMGGPPCQGFSLTGPRNFDDPRNQLYLAMIETVRRFNPKAFLIETVPGMANLYKGEIKDEIIRRFTEMGYTVSYKIVCAADYGVPQIRKRLVFV